MLAKFRIGDILPQLVDRVVASYDSDERTQHIDREPLPSRSAIIGIVRLLLELAYPDYVGRRNLNAYNVRFHVGELLPKIGETLHEQIYRAYGYRDEIEKKDDVAGVVAGSEDVTIRVEE